MFAFLSSRNLRAAELFLTQAIWIGNVSHLFSWSMSFKPLSKRYLHVSSLPPVKTILEYNEVKTDRLPYAAEWKRFSLFSSVSARCALKFSSSAILFSRTKECIFSQSDKWSHSFSQWPLPERLSWTSPSSSTALARLRSSSVKDIPLQIINNLLLGGCSRDALYSARNRRQSRCPFSEEVKTGVNPSLAACSRDALCSQPHLSVFRVEIILLINLRQRVSCQ